MGLSYVWINQNVENLNYFKLMVKTCLKDQYLQHWHQKLHESSKCVFYKCIKTNIAMEPYLLSLPKPLRNYMVRFRLSNHRLSVEILRYDGINKTHRICNKDDIGDECHYILYCTYFKQQRNAFLKDAYIYSCNISDEIKLKRLFNSRNVKMLFMRAKFLGVFLKHLINNVHVY